MPLSAVADEFGQQFKVDFSAGGVENIKPIVVEIKSLIAGRIANYSGRISVIHLLYIAFLGFIFPIGAAGTKICTVRIPNKQSELRFSTKGAKSIFIKFYTANGISMLQIPKRCGRVDVGKAAIAIGRVIRQHRPEIGRATHLTGSNDGILCFYGFNPKD